MIDSFTLQALVISTLVIFSILSSKLFFRFGFPILLIFLTFGMLAGADGPGRIDFSDYSLAQSIGIFALIYILFLGGLESEWDSLKNFLSVGIRLSIIGTILTALILGVLIHLLFPVLGFMESFLLGSIVSATDAASVFNIFKTGSSDLPVHLKKIIEFESGSNDAVGVLLTTIFMNLITADTSFSGFQFFRFFVMQVLVGMMMGYSMGILILYLMNSVKLGYDGLYLVFITASVPFIYAVTTVFQGNGFLAVYIAGIIVGRNKFIHKKSIFRFLNGYVWILQIGMFLCFGLLVYPTRMANIWVPGLLIGVLLILLARPLAVFISLFRVNLPIKEKLFISWVGLRGASPIILATFPIAQGLVWGDLLFHIVFFVVLVSLLIQGSLIPRVAQWLGILKVDPDRKIYRPTDFDNIEFPGMTLQELIVPYNSSVVDKALFEIKLPDQSHILLIARGEQFLIPSGNTQVKGGDVVWVLAKDDVMPIIGKTFMSIA
ncbi:potassium/proton antiporter [Leptospira levettii]|uniref:potassium/proton antiporter n=1 Tax=Leptospira levettii TaxID=2023178 RepID=UPI00223D8288|nr:potassium/proton antiporter [Leptospira levettii]MCW7494908.1 potassium/proton antiporter [Leptospira levettii]